MTDKHQGVLARIRDKLAGTTAPAAPEPVAETTAAPEPPRREHLFGSQYLVRQSIEETMRQRGYMGQQALLRRRLVRSGDDSQRQRNAAARRAGYAPGEVMWPSD